MVFVEMGWWTVKIPGIVWMLNFQRVSFGCSAVFSFWFQVQFRRCDVHVAVCFLFTYWITFIRSCQINVTWILLNIAWFCLLFNIVLIFVDYKLMENKIEEGEKKATEANVHVQHRSTTNLICMLKPTNR